MMKRGMLLVVSAFLLGACALPLPVQLASWAIDGISLITTHKSIADHGLSLIANKDCAMWRAVEGKNICSANDAGSTAVAIAATDNSKGIANFETAAGPAADFPAADFKDSSPVFESPALPPLDKAVSSKRREYSLNYDPSEFADAWAYIISSSPAPDIPTVTAKAHADHPPTVSLAASSSEGGAKVTPWFPIEVTTKIAKAVSGGKAMAVAKVKPSKKAPYTAVVAMYNSGGKAWLPIESAGKSSGANAIEVKAGLYFVIGSFSKRDRALSLAAKHILLKPKVAISRMDGEEINRVVVGPFAPGDKEEVHYRVRRDGIFDAWAERINPAKWSLLNPSESSDLAQLQL